MGEGDNSLTNNGSIRGAALLFGAGNDTVTNSGTLSFDEEGITLGDGENTINNQNGGKIITYKTIIGGKDKDIITNSGEITLYAQKGAQYAGIFLDKPDKYHTMDLGDGDNLITNNSGGVINAQIKMGSGNDTITNAGTINALEQTTYAEYYEGRRYDVKAIDGLIDFGAGNNSLTNAAGGIINGGMKFGDGDDSVINRGSITYSGAGVVFGGGSYDAVRLGDGQNQFSNYGSLKGWLSGGAGEDRIDLFAGSSYEGIISTGDGNDYVKIHGANIFKGTSGIGLGGGEDTLEISFDTLSGDSKLSSLIYTPDANSSVTYDGNGGDDILRLINGSTYTLDFDNGSHFQGFDSLELGGAR